MNPKQEGLVHSRYPIGILDSGIGGLSIWREIVKKLPQESTIYLADSLNCPYGSKSSREVYKLSKKLVEFLLKKKVKLIVIACNTITVTCLDKLRKDFPKTPIIGTVPVVKTASQRSKTGKIGIFSTNQTARSSYQKDLIRKFAGGASVLNIGTDKLVPLIEKGAAQRALPGGGESGFEISKILKEESRPFLDFKIDTLALGCSHFPFLKRQMQKILGKKVLILDSGGAIARQVERVLEKNNGLSVYNSPEHILLTTGDLKKFNRLSKKILEKRLKNVAIEKISL